jgi:bifunctional UDP-N-acetylglucosamine pyrophosphorylase/glucosamine-1-phosphate N-acetyltransferase
MDLPEAPRVAVILAAGKGTRMASSLPKVLHQVVGRPLLHWVVDAARKAECERILVVVGHGSERVREEIQGEDLEWIVQAEQRGTGHALAQAEPHVPGEALLFVLSGDVPMVFHSTLLDLAFAAAQGWGAMAVAEVEEPGGLGRVLTRPDGGLERIVEARDATPEILALRRVNAGIYVLPAPEIFDFLRGVQPNNAQGEIYLTDAVGAAAAAGRKVSLMTLEDPNMALGVNDRFELAKIHRLMIDRHLVALVRCGATILEPSRTVAEPGVFVDLDTVIHPDVSLLGWTQIGQRCTVHQGAWVRDSIIEHEVTIEPYSVLDGVHVESGCRVGPFARLRPGTRLRRGARVGNFVEVKASEIGPGAKAGHLSYIGDATVGEGANLGAGVVTCNYDGRTKHRTEIGAKAFIGSDTMLVAPVNIGEGASTAAGSVITKDVPAGALAVGRTRQKNLEGRAGGLRARRKPDGRPDGREEG